MKHNVTGSRPSFSIFVVGETGNGKSQLCQYLTRDTSVFHPSQGEDSFTQRVFHARATIDDFDVTVYDTPGLNDKLQDADARHIREMVTQLRGVKDCKAFLIVLNPHQPRFSGSTQQTIEYFRDIFGRDIVSNLGIVWTRASRQKAEYWRKNKEKDFVAKIGQLFGNVTGHIPSFYLNSLRGDEEYEYEEAFHWGEVRKMLTWANANQYRSCEGAKVVDTKQEELNKAVLAKKEAQDREQEQKKAAEEAAKKQKEAEEKLKQEREAAEQRRREDERRRQEDDRRRREEDKERHDALLTILRYLPQILQPNSMPSCPPFRPVYPFLDPSLGSAAFPSSSCLPSPSRGGVSSSPYGSGGGSRFYRGGQFIPGGGRAPKGGIWL